MRKVAFLALAIAVAFPVFFAASSSDANAFFWDRDPGPTYVVVPYCYTPRARARVYSYYYPPTPRVYARAYYAPRTFGWHGRGWGRGRGW
jgi:hypothetical protein